LLKVFYETFANKKKQPALILKTSGAGFSILDKEDTLRKMNMIKSEFPNDMKLPNVYLLHGEMSDVEMNHLYNHPKVKVMVSFTHGEGYGRPLQEATMVGLPVVVSNWSGHLDFLDGEQSLLLPGKIDTVPKSMVWKDIIISESNWFTVDESTAYNVMNHVFKNYHECKSRAKSLMAVNRNKFTHNKMTKVLKNVVDNCIQDKPSVVGLQLPKLKKSTKNKTDIPKIKLPKLRKLESV
jgi:glycosyltransferase involved in cell wall biosynthesis